MVFAAQADGGNSGLTSDITSGGDYDPTLDAGTITITITSTTGFSWSNSAGGSGTGTISTSPQTPQVSAGWEITFPQDPFPAGAIGDVWTFQVNNEENFGGERFCPEPGDTIEFADGQRRQLPINWTSGTDDDETGDDGNHDGGGGGTNQAKRWIFIPVTDPNTGYWYNTATGDRIAGTRNNPPF